MIVNTWHHCYPSNWKDKIVPDSFQHPAKFSSRLIGVIYEHLFSEGWVSPGDLVIDPFGGIALGALDAMRLGLAWRGVELEQRFAKTGAENIALWNKRFASMPKWSGDALLLQGDSRNLAEILAGAAGAVVTSPPFADVLSRDRVDPAERVALARELGLSNAADVSVIEMEKLGKRKQNYVVVTSPPYADGCSHEGGNDTNPSRMHGGTFIGVGITGAISSPPYCDSINSDNGIDVTKLHGHLGANSHIGFETRYGTGSAQLGAMKATDKSFRAAISSPPFASAQTGGGIAKVGYQNEAARKGSAEHPFDLVGKRSYMPENQGVSVGQLANENDGDFWTSARAIVAQVYQVLQPGGHAVWVVKDYVKNKQRVPFCDQWRELCESVGFIALHEHHATLVNHRGTSLTLEGGEIHHTTESKSFFRRLAEKKGSPRIDWETVLCMEKPA